MKDNEVSQRIIVYVCLWYKHGYRIVIPTHVCCLVYNHIICLPANYLHMPANYLYIFQLIMHICQLIIYHFLSCIKQKLMYLKPDINNYQEEIHSKPLTL